MLDASDLLVWTSLLLVAVTCSMATTQLMVRRELRRNHRTLLRELSKERRLRRTEGRLEALPAREAVLEENGAPPALPPRRVLPAPGWTRSSFHDPGAAAVTVRIARGVLERLFGELRAHFVSDERGNETGWVPVGRYVGGHVEVLGLIDKGLRARCGPGSMEIDTAFVAAARCLLVSREPGLVVTGLFHSHPPGIEHNSMQDRATDREHCQELAGPGIYPIFVESTRPVADAHGNVFTDRSVKGTFFAMDGGRPGTYVPCRVEVVDDGPDLSAWLAEHAEALEGCADTVFALATADVPVELLPAGQGGVVLRCPVVAAADGMAREVVCLFAPRRGQVYVRRGRRSAPVTETGGSLARQIEQVHALLTEEAARAARDRDGPLRRAKDEAAGCPAA